MGGGEGKNVAGLGSKEAGWPCGMGAGNRVVEWSGVETIWQLVHLGPASLYS